MAFKHFRNVLASADTDVSLYTVPSGREFVLMNMRVRNVNGASSTNTMTFKTVEGGQTNTVGEISIQSDEISKHGASIKRLMEAGSVIMARASISGMMAEAMGVEFNAGVWSTIHEWGGSSSSSEQSSSSSSEQSSSSYSEQELSIAVSFATNNYNFSGNYTYNSSSNRYERTDNEVTYTFKYYGNSTTPHWEFERSDWVGNYIYYNTNDSTVSGITGTHDWTGFGALVEGESFTVTITAMQESSSSEQQGGGSNVLVGELARPGDGDSWNLYQMPSYWAYDYEQSAYVNYPGATGYKCYTTNQNATTPSQIGVGDYVVVKADPAGDYEIRHISGSAAYKNDEDATNVAGAYSDDFYVSLN